MKLYWLICFLPLCSGFTHNIPKPRVTVFTGEKHTPNLSGDHKG